MNYTPNQELWTRLVMTAVTLTLLTLIGVAASHQHAFDAAMFGGLLYGLAYIEGWNAAARQQR